MNTTVRARYRLSLEMRVLAGVFGLIAGAFGVVAILAACGFGKMQGPSERNEWPQIFALLLLLASPAFWVAALYNRAQIVADERGVRWRGLGRWRCAAWNEVSDFASHATALNQPKFVVRTRRGDFKFSPAFACAPELLRVIAKRAGHVGGVAARTVSWRYENRWPDNYGLWPHLFSYRDNAENRVMPILMFVGVPLFLLLPFMPNAKTQSGWKSLAQVVANLRETGAMVPWPVAVLLYALLLLMWLGLPLLFLFIGAQLRRAGKSRELLVATAGGLWHSDGSSDENSSWRAIAWRECSDFSCARIGRPIGTFHYTLSSPRGALTWNQQIGGNSLLRAFIAQERPDLMQQLQSARVGNEDLASHREEADGSKLFSFRTRTARVMLVTPLLLAIFPPFMPLLMRWAESFSPDPRPAPALLPFLLMSGAGALVFLLAWHFYATSYVRVSPEGLEVRTPLRTRRLAWSEIRELVYEPGHGYVLRGHAGRKRREIGFYSYLPADFPILQAEIARYTGLTWPSVEPIARSKTRRSNV